MAETGAGSGPPRYEIVRATLAKRIRAGVLPRGLVLIEGPIADLFGFSRAPVRQALAALHRDGLIRRFRGRGYLVGDDPNAPPLRLTVDRALLGLETGVDVSLPRARIDVARIVRDVRDQSATAMAFGQYRLRESVLAGHFGVGRQVAHEVLLRLSEQRVIWKAPNGHWMTGPLTAKAVVEEYQIRRLLEPAALLDSAPHIPLYDIHRMRDRLVAYLDQKTAAWVEDNEQLETDLHERCLAGCNNERLRAVIGRNQLPLLVNRVFMSAVGPEIDQPGLEEHRLVLEHLLRETPAAAAAAMEAHLASAAKRTLRRLKSLSVLPEPEFPDYLSRQ